MPEPLTSIFPACLRMLPLVATRLQFVASQACPAEKQESLPNTDSMTNCKSQTQFNKSYSDPHQSDGSSRIANRSQVTIS
jgi:hypothetical protein